MIRCLCDLVGKQNMNHGETQRSWRDNEVYQKGTTSYLSYPNGNLHGGSQLGVELQKKVAEIAEDWSCFETWSLFCNCW